MLYVWKNKTLLQRMYLEQVQEQIIIIQQKQ